MFLRVNWINLVFRELSFAFFSFFLKSQIAKTLLSPSSCMEDHGSDSDGGVLWGFRQDSCFSYRYQPVQFTILIKLQPDEEAIQ